MCDGNRHHQRSEWAVYAGVSQPLVPALLVAFPTHSSRDIVFTQYQVGVLRLLYRKTSNWLVLSPTAEWSYLYIAYLQIVCGP